jgi:hypothetical protein
LVVLDLLTCITSLDPYSLLGNALVLRLVMAIQSGIHNGEHVSVPAVLKCRIIRFVSLTRAGLGSYSRKEAVFRILPHCSSLNDVISVGIWKHGLS